MVRGRTHEIGGAGAGYLVARGSEFGGLRGGQLPNQIGTASRFGSLCGIIPAGLLIVVGDCQQRRFVPAAWRMAASGQCIAELRSRS